ncbi:MAG: radical SAM protein [Lachnospiraceae bacterium]|nr:radical SAM protein [Lachnospiraceae bacterium]
MKKGSTVFSEIYVEKGALTYPLTNRILSRFPERKVTEIAHYKDIFNVAGQDFLAQKRSPALILAVNNGKRIYDGARPCQNFGHEHFYYTSQVKNCLYDCEYCFLRGMYPSGNIVIFVNTDDYFSDIDAELKNHPLYLSIAYDTDLLALEGFTGIVKKYCEFAADRPELLIEIRTKCASGDVTKSPAVPSNIILAYTVSPDPIARAYEHWAGSFQARKSAIYSSLKAGIRTRLCIDPMIAVIGWNDIYGSMIDELFSEPVMAKLEDISVGTFRISSSYIKRLKKTALTPISAYPYENTDGMCGYDKKLRMEMTEFVKERIGRYYPVEKIFISDY